MSIQSPSSQCSNGPEPHRDELIRDSYSFERRHIGPSAADRGEMLRSMGFSSMDDLIDRVVPAAIRQAEPLRIGPDRTEQDVLSELRGIAAKNKVFRSFIGMGYYGCITPPVVLRNILENPGWYTHYTPYQPEIAQGRLEALLNFQTLIRDLTALDVANASLLDEGTAAAEAMRLSYNACRQDTKRFLVSAACHPQTIAVVRTRAESMGLEMVVGNHAEFDFDEPVFGALVQYPTTEGVFLDYADFCARAHAAGALVTVAADLLSLTLFRPPGEFGADIAVGSTQRFGVPLGFGGPSAAYFAIQDEQKRLMPGRLVGVTKDAEGKTAYRLALQTREQHIRREKATSNICTAQVLLAVMASMYAVYHGPDGLRRIARRIQLLTGVLARGLGRAGYRIGPEPHFDTLRVELAEGESKADILAACRERQINLRPLDDNAIGISLDETANVKDVQELLSVFAPKHSFDVETLAGECDRPVPAPHARASAYLTHPVFNRYHSETEMMRYIHRLESKDLALNTAMIPLGSCTMKLNAAAEMIPVSWPEFAGIHPFVPEDQAAGYHEMFRQLQGWLADVTGFSAVTLQPNSGAQGEFTGLLVIRRFQQESGQGHRNVCLIPCSAHGTNPASAIMAGLEVVVVDCDQHGNIDIADLKAKATKHADRLAVLMVTYPSTHGVFEENIKEICAFLHARGGQVYMDGANLNALVGLVRPAELGADVCHINLHKTFAIPHGGGGPGMGPIAVKPHLAPYLPGHPIAQSGGERAIGPISSSPWGSASILPISWAYISMMGSRGLAEATKAAILNANYVAHRLEAYYPIVYKGQRGLIAHECILDLRPLKKRAGIEVDDVAKRLMDYGFHAPTVSFPVAGTMMVEPTESESRQELDRFCDAMVAIYEEVVEIEQGKADVHDNLLKNAPHPVSALLKEPWNHPYSRDRAAFPVPGSRERKVWPAVGRIDNVYGDRHVVCTCPSVEEYR
jgi:glycine dehydrogenase